MDFVDVVFHLFLPEARDFYAIERLWGEAVLKRYDEV
jgi:ribosomal silencing factor RsfS